jgi:hypothetical protein
MSMSEDVDMNEANDEEKDTNLIMQLRNEIGEVNK